MSDDKDQPPAPPVESGVPPRPDIPAPPTDSMGRSMANKRGRKPGPQGPRNADVGQTLKSELTKRLPTDGALMTDENVGKALSGAFSVIGIVGGPHWRLMKKEQDELGELYGPLARMFGPEELAKWIMALMVLPGTTAIIMPRLAIQSMIQKGEIEKEHARVSLIQCKGMMAAEANLDIEAQVLEQAAVGNQYLRAQVSAAQTATAEMKAQQVIKEGVVVPRNGAQVPQTETVAVPASGIDIPGDKNG